MTPASRKVQEYRRTIPGLVTLIYSNQKMTSRRYGRADPSYSKNELLSWLISQPHFKCLFNNWVASGYDRQLSPSIDRLNNTLGYSLQNIQLVTAGQNLKNQKAQNRDGTYPHAKSKAIRQLTKQGDFVGEHHSVMNALRAVGGKSASNISNVANGRWKSAYGYRWEWA